MSRVIISSVILFFMLSELPGQTFAIYVDAPDKDMPVNQKAYSELVSTLKNKIKVHGWLFNSKDDQLVIDTSFQKGDNETAADYLLSVFFTINEDYDLDLKFYKDTTNKITGAYFPIGPLTRYKIIMTDLRTNEMLQFNGKLSQSHGERTNGKHIALSADQFKKYFGPAGPAALRAKSEAEYEKVVKRITQDFKPKFQEYYDDNRLDFTGKVGDIVRQTVIHQPESIQSPEVDGNKLKSFRIAKPKGVELYKGMEVTVFSLDTLDQFVIPANYKSWIVDEVLPDYAIAENKFLIPSKGKEAAEALEAGKKLYFLPGSLPFAANMSAEPPITIALKGQELHGATDVYNFLSRSPRMRIINSLEENIIKQFHERYKGIQFIESGYSLSALGANIILSSSDIDFVIQDAETGTVLGSCPKKYGDKGIYDLLQKSLDLKIRIIKVLDMKKDALKEALVYSPMGFYEDFYFDIMAVTPEIVNGRTLYRETEIGRGNIMNEDKYGYIFGEAKFNKGEKEIGNAYTNNQNILFVSHEFKIPFIGSFK